MSFRINLQEDDEQHNTANHIDQDNKESRWKNITNDILLSLILKRHNTTLDLCRFRSICKSWRNFSTPLPRHHLLFPLSLPPLHSNSNPFSLSPTLVYLLSPQWAPPETRPAHPWLVKVSESGERKWDLLNPLTKRHKLYSRPGMYWGDFGLNFLGFRSCEVGRSYFLQLEGNKEEFEESLFDFEGFSSCISVKKVVVNFVNDYEKVCVLGLFNYGEVAVWNSGEENWGFVKVDKKEDEIVDIICFYNRFSAVNRRGRLLRVDTAALEIKEEVEHVEECSMMCNFYLVESNFRLYLVNKIVSPRPITYYDEGEEDWVVDKNSGKPLWFKVFVLNEKEKRWDRVKSVGNRVFFVTRDVAFSVSTEDLVWSKGDCIYFEGMTGYDDEADMVFGLNAGVYSMEDEAVVTFGSVPDRWTEIFWPPSSWFRSNEDYPDYEMHMQD